MFNFDPKTWVRGLWFPFAYEVQVPLTNLPAVYFVKWIIINYQLTSLRKLAVIIIDEQMVRAAKQNWPISSPDSFCSMSKPLISKKHWERTSHSGLPWITKFVDKSIQCNAALCALPNAKFIQKIKCLHKF